jgi:hypothetical protein
MVPQMEKPISANAYFPSYKAYRPPYNTGQYASPFRFSLSPVNVSVDPSIYNVLGDFQAHFGSFDSRTLTPIPVVAEMSNFVLLGRLTVYPSLNQVLWTPLAHSFDDVIALTRVNAADLSFGTFYDGTWTNMTCEVCVLQGTGQHQFDGLYRYFFPADSSMHAFQCFSGLLWCAGDTGSTARPVGSTSG